MDAALFCINPMSLEETSRQHLNKTQPNHPPVMHDFIPLAFPDSLDEVFLVPVRLCLVPLVQLIEATPGHVGLLMPWLRGRNELLGTKWVLRANNMPWSNNDMRHGHPTIMGTFKKNSWQTWVGLKIGYLYMK